MLNIGLFGNYDLWKNATNLINFQVKQKQKNKHFQTLQMKYFENLDETYINLVQTEDYYNKRIHNSFFYGNPEEFFIYDFPKPKSYFKVRNNKFPSYVLLGVHNMIGLYLLKVAENYIENFNNKNPNIHSFYGGNLKFQDNDLILNSDRIFYSSHYKKFRSLLENEKKNEKNIIIRIDIENYFNSISVKKLLNKIPEYVTKEKILINKFNLETRKTIEFFYKFISSKEEGIPIMENGIISNFLGNLYLMFAEIEILDVIKEKYSTYLESYKIIRYVDDIFFSLEFKEPITKEKKGLYSLKILSDISDLLYQDYDLKLNDKTKVFDLSCGLERSFFEREINTSSVDERIDTDEDTTLKPQDKLDNIFNELSKMNSKESKIDLFINPLKNIDNIDLEIFRDIYDIKVGQIIKKADNQTRLKLIFDNMNFKLLKTSPKPMVALLLFLADKSNYDKVITSLLEKDFLNSTDINLILELLCQTNFEDAKLVKKLEENNYLCKIIQKFKKNDIDEIKGYSNLELNKLNEISPFSELISVELIFQIIQREYSEKKEEFSLALNHLVNEIQLLCFKLDESKTDFKKYLATDVSEFLSSHISNKNNYAITNMFSVRNNNQISHGVNNKVFMKEIEKTEYLEYKKVVQNCIQKIL